MAITLTCNADIDRLAEGRDNEDSTDVGNSKEIVDPLNERSDTDTDTLELGDGKLTDKVGKDVDPATWSLMETLGTLKVGVAVDGTVSTSETVDSDESTDGKDEERLSESYDRISVGSTVESAVN